jgi:hypothetical protein
VNQVPGKRAGCRGLRAEGWREQSVRHWLALGQFRWG